MSDLLEDVLRDAFHLRAAQLDSGATARLLAVDYRPRQRRLPSVRLLAVGAVGAVAAGVAVAVLLVSSATPAFAGWTPVPTSPAPGQTAAALRQCRSGSPVLTDTRGPYTAAVYSLPNGGETCLSGGSLTLSGGGDTGSVASGQIQLVVTSENDSSDGPFTVFDGRVGAGVTAVTIARSHGVPVVATVSHGWYLAWWPGSAHATFARITTTAGTHNVRLPAIATQGSPSCGAGLGCASIGQASSR